MSQNRKRLGVEEVFSPEYVRYTVQAVRENPRGFLKTVAKRCKTVSVQDALRAMRAWGIKV